MAAWVKPKTWGVGPWTVADANTFLRDNMITSRASQRLEPVVVQLASFTLAANVVTTVRAASDLLGGGSLGETTRVVGMAEVRVTSTSGVVNQVDLALFKPSGAVVSPATTIFRNLRNTLPPWSMVMAHYDEAPGSPPGLGLSMVLDAAAGATATYVGSMSFWVFPVGQAF